MDHPLAAFRPSTTSARTTTMLVISWWRRCGTAADVFAHPRHENRRRGPALPPLSGSRLGVTNSESGVRRRIVPGNAAASVSSIAPVPGDSRPLQRRPGTPCRLETACRREPNGRRGSSPASTVRHHGRRATTTCCEWCGESRYLRIVDPPVKLRRCSLMIAGTLGTGFSPSASWPSIHANGSWTHVSSG